MRKPRTLPKPTGKQLRVRIQRPDLLQGLRDKMLSPTGIGGLVWVPGRPLTDGHVIDFALTVADMTLGEDITLINRPRFLRALNDALNLHIDSMAKMAPEEREALVQTLVTAGLSFRE